MEKVIKINKMKKILFLALYQALFDASVALDIAVLDFYPELEINSSVSEVSVTPESGVIELISELRYLLIFICKFHTEFFYLFM
jgi:hypothetical protein